MNVQFSLTWIYYPIFCSDSCKSLWVPYYLYATKFLLNLGFHVRTKTYHLGHGRCWERGAKQESLNILGSLLAIHQYGKGLLMERTNLASSIHHVDVSQCVERIVLVWMVELAAKNIVGMSLFIWFCSF